MSDKKRAEPSGSKTPKIVKKNRFNFKKPGFLTWDFSKIKNLNKNTVLAASLAAVLLLVGVFSFAFQNNTKEVVVVDEAPEEIIEIKTASVMPAVVTLQDGTAEYKTDKDWTTVPKDLDILAGMSIRTTGATSRLIITLDDGSEVRLDANTEVSFETITVTRVIILQENGHVYNRVTPSSSRTYIVQTENGQFQSLGTAFKTTSNGDEESVEVYQNSVEETSINKNASEGEKLIVKDFRNPAKDETVEKLDIEQVKKDPFISWNRVQDELNDKFRNSLGFLSDIVGPEISITSPKLGSTIDIDTNAVEGTIEIEGTTEKGTNLTVESKSVKDSKEVNVAVTNDGTFKTPVLKAPIGNAVFNFIATDKTGNKTTLSITLLFKKKNVVQKQGIALTLDTTDLTKLVFAWGLVGVTTPDGVKLVYGEVEEPTFPDDLLQDVDSKLTETIDITDPPFESGKTYYFRVCRYSTATTDCDIYSNEVFVEIP